MFMGHKSFNTQHMKFFFIVVLLKVISIDLRQSVI